MICLLIEIGFHLKSFGEVNQITRMPDGDLHVHFRDAEVAETVRASAPLL